MGTKVYSNNAHIEAFPVFGNYVLTVRDNAIDHVNEPLASQACYGVSGIWRNIASRLEHELEEFGLSVEMFSYPDEAYLSCKLAEKPAIDVLLQRFTSRHPLRPVSKSA